MKRTVNLARTIFAIFSGGSFGFALLVGGIGEARGDLVQLSSPASYSFQESAQADSSNLGAYNPSGVASSPSSVNYYNSFSAPGFSAATNVTVSYSATETPNSFTANVGFYSAAQAFSSIDPSSPLSVAYANAEGSLGLYNFTVSQPAVATVTWNATNLLGSNSVYNPYNYPDSEAYIASSLEIYGSNGSYAYVESELYQKFQSPSAGPTSGLFAVSETGSPSYIFTDISANSISLVLAPGTYSIVGDSDTSVQFYQTNGYFNYPQSGSGGSITIDALSTPEPASLVLLGTGAVGLIGVARRRRRKSAA